MSSLTIERLDRFQRDLRRAYEVPDWGIHTDRQLIVSRYHTEQFRFPRSRRRRIRKKWAARPENFRPRRDFLVGPGLLLCHPVMERELREAFEFAPERSSWMTGRPWCGPILANPIVS